MVTLRVKHSLALLDKPLDGGVFLHKLTGELPGGDAGCWVMIRLEPTARSQAAEGREYVKG